MHVFKFSADDEKIFESIISLAIRHGLYFASFVSFFSLHLYFPANLKKKYIVDFKVSRYSLNSEKTEDLRLSFELSSIFLLNYHD